MTTTTLVAPISLSNDLLTGGEWSPTHTRELLHLSADIKARPVRYASTLHGKFIALIFENPSLRTRVTFEVSIQSIGGSVIFLDHPQASASLGARESIAAPTDYAPAAEVVADGKRIARETKAKIDLLTDPRKAVAGAQGVYTDSWTSMGFEEEGEVLNAVFQPYQVNAQLMSLAAPDAVFMHCLPAHRGLEVTPEILDGPHSLVLDQSANRMYVQKAILHTLF